MGECSTLLIFSSLLYNITSHRMVVCIRTVQILPYYFTVCLVRVRSNIHVTVPSIPSLLTKCCSFSKRFAWRGLMHSAKAVSAATFRSSIDATGTLVHHPNSSLRLRLRHFW